MKIPELLTQLGKEKYNARTILDEINKLLTHLEATKVEQHLKEINAIKGKAQNSILLAKAVNNITENFLQNPISLDKSSIIYSLLTSNINFILFIINKIIANQNNDDVLKKLDTYLFSEILNVMLFLNSLKLLNDELIQFHNDKKYSDLLNTYNQFLDNLKKIEQQYQQEKNNKKIEIINISNSSLTENINAMHIVDGSSLKKISENTTPDFSTLPDNTIKHILSLLDGASLSRIKQTNKNMNKLQKSLLDDLKCQLSEQMKELFTHLPTPLQKKILTFIPPQHLTLAVMEAIIFQKNPSLREFLIQNFDPTFDYEFFNAIVRENQIEGKIPKDHKVRELLVHTIKNKIVKFVPEKDSDFGQIDHKKLANMIALLSYLFYFSIYDERGAVITYATPLAIARLYNFKKLEKIFAEDKNFYTIYKKLTLDVFLESLTFIDIEDHQNLQKALLETTVPNNVFSGDLESIFSKQYVEIPRKHSLLSYAFYKYNDIEDPRQNTQAKTNVIKTLLDFACSRIKSDPNAMNFLEYIINEHDCYKNEKNHLIILSIAALKPSILYFLAKAMLLNNHDLLPDFEKSIWPESWCSLIPKVNNDKLDKAVLNLLKQDEDLKEYSQEFTDVITKIYQTAAEENAKKEAIEKNSFKLSDNFSTPEEESSKAEQSFHPY